MGDGEAGKLSLELDCALCSFSLSLLGSRRLRELSACTLYSFIAAGFRFAVWWVAVDAIVSSPSSALGEAMVLNGSPVLVSNLVSYDTAIRNVLGTNVASFRL